MDDLISRKGAIEKFNCVDPSGTFAYCSSIIKTLMELPSAEPVLELVRCKDCKHREQYDCNNITLGGTKCGVTDDWFCADGERKETEDDND